jgi:CSLREA domain-containing protein
MESGCGGERGSLRRGLVSGGAVAVSRIRVWAILLATALALLLWAGAAVAAPPTLVVNSNGDASDANLEDGVCLTAGDVCTLRAAIEQANANPNPDSEVEEIHFNIGGGAGVKVIAPASALPAITDTVLIDGYTQPGASPNSLEVGSDAVLLIELNGTGAGVGASGLEINSSDGIVRGLVINRFAGNGIVAFGLRSTVEGNHIGTNPAGTSALANGSAGVALGNRGNVGGTAPEARNVISGNGGSGVHIVTGNLQSVQGNYIGTDAGGTVDLGNAGDGVRATVFIGFVGSNASTIGGSTAGAGNVISGNGGNGVEVDGSGEGRDIQGTRVEGNLIGTNAAGTVDLGNSGDGVFLFYASGSFLTANVISGNDGNGVKTAEQAFSNHLEANFIGTNASGSDLGNSGNGVFADVGSFGNFVGPFTGGSGNTIAFNGGDGVRLVRSSFVRKNSIHSNVELGIDLGADGVSPNDADESDFLQNFPVITSAVNDGGTIAVEATVKTSPAKEVDFDFFVSPQCDASRHGEGQSYIGSASAVTDSSGNAVVAEAFPGSIPAGHVVTATTATVPTGQSEFSLCSPRPPLVVNSVADFNDFFPEDEFCRTQFDPNECTLRAAIEQANFTPGHDEIRFAIGSGQKTLATFGEYRITDPVTIDATTQPGYSGTPLIELNGAIAEPFPTDAFKLQSGGSTIRGLALNRFTADGIEITGPGGNVVEANYIGTDVTGTLDRGNLRNGVFVNGSAGNSILDNVISGNDLRGVFVTGASAAGNVVRGNLIGTNAAGTAQLGNSGDGITINNAPATRIGGTGADAGNVVSGNGRRGIAVVGSGATGTIVRGNAVGADGGGSADVGNASDGVVIASGASDSSIGGPGPNTIAFNDGDGVNVASGDGNSVPRNSIFSNGGLGIDLRSNGVTLNDTGDEDGGANGLQNFPRLTQASVAAGVTTLRGSLDSTPETVFRLRFFSSVSCDSSGHGEGRTYLGSASVTTDDLGDAAFEKELAQAVPAGSAVTATATDPAGNTSEFSLCRAVPPPSITINDVKTKEGHAGTKTLTFTVSLSNASATTVSVRYATANGTAVAPRDYIAKALTTLTFAPGETTKPVAVTINGDRTREASERFFVRLTSPTNATIARAQGIGTILNDD